MKNLAILGFGTVGQGLYEILTSKKDKISNLIGDDFTIKTIMVNNIDKKRDLDSSVKITDNYEDIVNDKEIDVVIELTGALEKGYEYIKRALESGKDVVSANKSVISKYYDELHDISAKTGKSLLYEASVGGGIPIIKPLKEEILINDIDSIQGILNGTCNYILTRMFKERISYEEILKDAQDLGYAEADPSADVDGLDTMRKLRILSTIAFGADIDEEEILTSGISKIMKEDVDYIRGLDSTIKLLGTAKLYDEGYIATVEPTIVEQSDYFASVDMAYNSIAFTGENIGPLKFFGAGAGKLPTGDAVARDVVDILVGHPTMNQPVELKKLRNLNKTLKSKYYVRIKNHEDIIRPLSDRFQPIEFKEKNDIAFFIFKNINRSDLVIFLKERNVSPEDCFIAKVGY